MRPWVVARIGVGALLLTVLAGMPTAQAYEDWQDWNRYVVSDLPEFIVAPTPFTVTVDGPVPVCSMTYQKTTLTAPPWQFTAPLESDDPLISITTCDGQVEGTYVDATPAFRFGSHFLTPFKTTKKGPTYKVWVYNNLPQPMTATVTNAAGKVLATANVPSSDSAEQVPALTFSPGKLSRTTTFKLRATAADGTTMESSVLVPAGWSMDWDEPTEVNCSTVSWFYDKAHQPKDARNIVKDIVTALAKLSARSGLTYVRTTDPKQATLTFRWANLGDDGPSGVGTMSTDSNDSVTFNTRDEWPEDRNAGSGVVRGYLPGRVWLIVHETMHTLGFGHVYDRTQVMNPVGYMASFGKGDLAGLHTLYPKAACRV